MSELYYTKLKINNSQIFEASILEGTYSSSAPLGDLPIVPNTLTLRLYIPLSANIFTLMPIGSSVYYYCCLENTTYTVEKLVLKQINLLGYNTYELICVSPVGLLENTPHYGGIYNNAPFSAVLSNIIGGKFSYTVAPAVSDVPICGWLPVSTALKNLRQLLIACGVFPLVDSSGLIIFRPVTRVYYSTPGGARTIYGQKIENIPDISKVNVTEHTFSAASASPVSTLFSGYAPSNTFVAPSGTTRTGTLVTFSSPVHSLSVTGSSILESGANYAVIASSPYATITGKYYVHNRRIVSAKNSSAPTENVRDYKNLTLVSLLNSESVAERILSYYTGRARLCSSFIPHSEKSGTAVTLPLFSGGTVSGIISTFKRKLTRTNSTYVTLDRYSDSVLPGNSYSNVSIITQSGSYTIPSGVSRIRVVLIGGGSGGSGGGLGANGNGGVSKYSTSRQNQTVAAGAGGNGGAAGSAGQGGKIFITTMSVTPGSSYTAQIGAGGSGGVGIKRTSPEGTVTDASDGSATTFGSYSSQNGVVSETGFFDSINQVAYALSGNNGKNGGKGGNGGSVPTDTPTSPTNGAGNGINGSNGSTGLVSVGTGASNGGKGGNYTLVDYHAMVGYYYCCGGGGGGGSKSVTPSSSAAGGVGSGTLDANPSITNGYISTLCGGNGGNGSDAVSAASVSSTRYGCGGNGGNGGGGGGGGGAAMLDYDSRSGGATISSLHTTYASGAPGIGGNGGNGSNGVSGCVLVYY